MKVIIAGCRDFTNYDLLKSKCDFYLQSANDLEIVSGGAKGADELGERYAKENNIPLKIFKADWQKLGKSAGPVRNEEMAKYANALIAFWDGKSRGTANMIGTANHYNLKVRKILI